MIICDGKGTAIKGVAIDIVEEFMHVTDAVREALIKNGLPEDEVKQEMRASFEIGMLNEKELDAAETLLAAMGIFVEHTRKEEK